MKIMGAIKKYRNNGAVGALLDEYEKAIEELKTVISDISKEDMVEVVDSKTEDEDCRSIQTILTHVVRAGYTYAIEVRKWRGEKLEYKNKELLGSVDKYSLALDEMFAYNIKLFEDYPSIKLEEKEPGKKMLVRWGQFYDAEQLFEHAIVHILRHRRQIERFKIKLKDRENNI